MDGESIIPKSALSDGQLQQLMSEIPKIKQTIVQVVDAFPSEEAKIIAEQNFLENKQKPLNMKDAKTVFDFEYLRRILKQAPLRSLYITRDTKDCLNRSKVETVSREYEDNFLREPQNNERACPLGSACESFEMGNFVCREFLLPSQLATYTKDGTLPQYPQICLLCRRSEICKMYINCRSDNSPAAAVISDIRNLVGVPGEYDIKQCLLPTPGLLLFDPVVLHVRENYKPWKLNALQTWKQEGYIKPEVKTFLGHRPGGK